MEHEQVPSPEQEHRPRQDVFDLEKLTSEQVGALISALGLLYESQPPEAQTGTNSPGDEALYILGNDMTAYAERAPDKAVELFQTLTVSNDNWTKRVALLQLAGPLLRQHANEPAKRQPVIDRWVELLEDEDEEVAETAAETLSSTVYASRVEGWLDGPTLEYLNSRLPF